MKQPKYRAKKISLDALVFGALSQLQALGYDGRLIAAIIKRRVSEISLIPSQILTLCKSQPS